MRPPLRASLTPPGVRKRPWTVLSESSPYGSGRLVIETDSAVSAAYLLDEHGAWRSSLWLANHEAAPPDLDRERVDAGLLPPMPASRTRQPEGSARPRARSLEVMWFEEGDGAALLQDGSPMGVLPGWYGSERECPGYSRDVTTRTPMAWPLDEIRDALPPRLARAREFWHAGRAGWNSYQRAVLSHLDARMSARGHYWRIDRDLFPRLGVVEHPPTGDRPFSVASTVGMGYQRMPVPSGYAQPDGARIELAVATRTVDESVVDALAWLGPYPWRRRRFLGSGHGVAWDGNRDTGGNTSSGTGNDTDGDTDRSVDADNDLDNDLDMASSTAPASDAPGAWRRWRGALLLADPSLLPGGEPPDLGGFTARGEPVRWLWIVPITARERTLGLSYGVTALMDDLRASGREWQVSLT